MEKINPHPAALFGWVCHAIYITSMILSLIMCINTCDRVHGWIITRIAGGRSFQMERTQNACRGEEKKTSKRKSERKRGVLRARTHTYIYKYKNITHHTKRTNFHFTIAAAVERIFYTFSHCSTWPRLWWSGRQWKSSNVTLVAIKRLICITLMHLQSCES